MSPFFDSEFSNNDKPMVNIMSILYYYFKLFILFYNTILMLNKVSAVVLGVLLCFMYGKTLFDRKTIVLNSSRMKRLNNNYKELKKIDL